MSDRLDAIKARIRALQARTKANGCTEAEAAAAAAALVRLMAEHGLSDADVATGEENVKLTRGPDIRDNLLNSIARVARCSAYTRTAETRCVVYVGRHPWPECAAWLHGVVFGAVARASRDFAGSDEQRRRRSVRTRVKARAAFLSGLVMRIWARLNDLAEAGEAAEVDRRMAKAAVGGIAGLENRPTKPISAPEARFEGAFLAGAARGDAVQLGWGIGGPAATRAIKGPQA